MRSAAIIFDADIKTDVATAASVVYFRSSVDQIRLSGGYVTSAAIDLEVVRFRRGVVFVLLRRGATVGALVDALVGDTVGAVVTGVGVIRTGVTAGGVTGTGVSGTGVAGAGVSGTGVMGTVFVALGCRFDAVLV